MSDFCFPFLIFLCRVEKDNGCLQSTRSPERADLFYLLTLLEPLAVECGPKSCYACLLNWKESPLCTCLKVNGMYKVRDWRCTLQLGTMPEVTSPQETDLKTPMWTSSRETGVGVCGRSEAPWWDLFSLWGNVSLMAFTIEKAAGISTVRLSSLSKFQRFSLNLTTLGL